MTATPMTAPTAPVMQAESLTRHYGVSQGFMKPKVTVKALVDVSFTLTAGQTLAVVGESGCGKSTLARQLTLIEPPTGGRLQVGDEWVTPGDRAQYKRLRSQVQMVFQNPYASLNPRQKIGHQIAEPLLLNTTLSFPPGYLRCFKYNLACEIAAEFGVEAPPTVRDPYSADCAPRTSSTADSCPTGIDDPSAREGMSHFDIGCR